LPAAIAIAEAPPEKWKSARFAPKFDAYAAQAKAIVIRHISRHQVVAILEIVSPGNKSSRNGLRTFVDKAVDPDPRRRPYARRRSPTARSARSSRHS